MTPQGPNPPVQPTGSYAGAPPPGPYGYPPPIYGYAPPAVTTTSTTAIISLVCGVVCWTIVPFIGALVAVITGHIARGEIRRSAGRVTGGGMATAGLVLGYIQLVGTILLVVVIIAIALAGGGN